MTKSQIKIFLSRQEEKALQNVDEEYDKLIEEAKDKTLIPFKEDIDKLQELFNKAQEVLSKIDNDIQNNKEIDFYYSSGLSYCYSDIKCNVYDQFKSEVEYKNYVQVLENKKNSLRKNIVAEYNKLNLLVKNTSSVKKIVEQLENFGFGLSRNPAPSPRRTPPRAYRAGAAAIQTSYRQQRRLPLCPHNPGMRPALHPPEQHER